MIHTNTYIAHQIEVSVDNIEHASPQNQTDNEEILTVDDNNDMITMICMPFQYRLIMMFHGFFESFPEKNIQLSVLNITHFLSIM